MKTKVHIGELSEVDVNPNDWVKSIYLPFHKKWTSQGSVRWKIFHFMGHTKKGRPRVYDSFGRSEAEAKLGLERAKVRGKDLTAISKAEYTRLKTERKNHKAKLRENHAY